MASLGNVGKTFANPPLRGAWSAFDQGKRPTSVTMHIVSAVPGCTAILVWRGTIIPTTGAPTGRTVADGSGNINFYDMDDSNGNPYYIYTIGTGEDWSATVVGSVVTVTQLHTANRSLAYAFA